MNGPVASPAELAALVRKACLLDVTAFKPGNVSFASPGHRMTARDFAISARAVAVPLTTAGLTVGARILHAIEATRAAVGCNTNLGIVLLLAPLVQAAIQAAGIEAGGIQGGVTENPDLHQRMCRVLNALTVNDAAKAFAAIQLANPGGLGESARHDVRNVAQVTLLQAMQEAADRDRVAAQYASGYADVFSIGVPTAADAILRWHSNDWAATAVYFRFMSAFADSHIARKFGREKAAEIVAQAAEIHALLEASDDPVTLLPQLTVLDQQWKQAGINPGTCADLTVATFFALQLQALFKEKVSGWTAIRAAGHHPKRASRRESSPRCSITIVEEK